MNDSITITLSYEDYLAANWLKVKERWRLKRSLAFLAKVAILYAAIVAIGEIQDRGLSVTTALICLGMGILIGLAAMLGIRLWLLWCLPRSARKMYLQQPSASAPYELSFDQDGFRAVGPFESSNLPWSHFSSWLENERLILLSKTPLTFFCLPKEQLGAEIEAELKTVLTAAGVKKGL